MTTIIVAVDRKNGIGKNNDLPFPSDLSFFKETTVGNVVIMGRKTWESLKVQPLPDRINIVVSTRLPDGRFKKSKTPDFSDEAIEKGTSLSDPFFVVHSLSAAVKLAEKDHADKKHFIIGGELLYKSAFDTLTIDDVILTKFGIEADCDRFFPKTTKELEEMFPRWKAIRIDNDGLLPYVRIHYKK